jgi:hypothetical protein
LRDLGVKPTKALIPALVEAARDESLGSQPISSDSVADEVLGTAA